jgi:hypothetical protein
MCLLKRLLAQMLRMEVSSTKSRKPIQNAPTKVNQVVHRMLFPLLETPLASHVSFTRSDSEPVVELLERLQDSLPSVMDDKTVFLSVLEKAYDAFSSHDLRCSPGHA